MIGNMQENNQVFNTIQEIAQYVQYLFINVFTLSFWKVISVTGYIIFSFFFDIGQANALAALFVLIIMDFITGISAAKVAGEKIRSSKIRHSAIKICAYFSVIAGAHLAETGLSTYI